MPSPGFRTARKIRAVLQPGLRVSKIEKQRLLLQSLLILNLHGLDAVVLERERADTLARCRKVSVEHGRSRHRDGGFTDAAPEATGGHHDGFDMRLFANAHGVVGVEVL